MIDQEYIELIHKEVDGATTPEETSRLKAFMADNIEAGRLFAELSKLTKVLVDVGQVEPPAGMKKRILDSIQPAVKRVEPNRGPWVTIINAIHSRDVVGYACSLAAGVVIALAAAAWFIPGMNEPGLLNQNHLSGTILPGAIIGNLETVDTKEYNLAGVSGSLTTRNTGSLVIADLVVVSAQPVEFEIGFDPATLGFVGLSHVEQSEFALRTGPGRIQLSSEGSDLSGQNRFQLQFKKVADRNSLITMTVRISGKESNVTVNTAVQGQ